jgi:hypothetical protein
MPAQAAFRRPIDSASGSGGITKAEEDGCVELGHQTRRGASRRGSHAAFQMQSRAKDREHVYIPLPSNNLRCSTVSPSTLWLSPWSERSILQRILQRTGFADG